MSTLALLVVLLLVLVVVLVVAAVMHAAGGGGPAGPRAGAPRPGGTGSVLPAGGLPGK